MGTDMSVSICGCELKDKFVLDIGLSPPPLTRLAAFTVSPFFALKAIGNGANRLATVSVGRGCPRHEGG
jgi:hypothetical protein